MGFIAFISLAVLCFFGVLLSVCLSSSRSADSFEALSQYEFPTVVQEVFAREHPDYTGEQRAQAFAALKEFFCLLYLEKQAGRKGTLGMPSALADEAWHVFILCTGCYEAFCKRFFGMMVHHTPDPKAQPKHMGDADSFKADVRRTWLAYRKHGERHDVFQATRLAGVMVPLLFALDAAASVDGWTWTPEALTRLDAAAQADAAAAAERDSGGGGGCGGATAGGGGGSGGGCSGGCSGGCGGGCG